jgi:CDP-4-dehydro-6-deoxyglucose reductase
MLLQFHVRQVEGDAFSAYVFERLKTREKVEIVGPFGDFVLDEDTGRPIVFLAYETGFAPIKSLIEHAISLDLPQPLRLYWVARHAQDHYMANHCRSWREALDDFRFTPLVADSHGASAVRTGADDGARQRAMLAAARRVTDDLADLGGHDVYVNGPKEILAPTRELLLRHNLPQDRLFIDHVRRY